MFSQGRNNKVVALVLFFLGVGYFSYAIDRYAFSFLVPNIAAAFAIPLSLSGLLGTIFLYGQIAGSIPAGFFQARYGYKFTLSVGIGVATFGIFLTAIAVNTNFIVVARIITGIGEGFWNVAIVLALANIFYNRKGTGVGISQNFFGVGLFFGPFLASLILDSTNQWRDVFYIFALTGAIGTALVLFGAKRSYIDPERVKKGTFKPINKTDTSKIDFSIFRNWRVYIPVLLFSLYEIGFWGWTISVSTYLEHVLKFPVVTAGFLAGADGISIMALSWLTGFFGDKFGRRWAFVLGGAAQGVVAVIAYSFFTGFYTFLLLALIFGFFTIMIYITIYSYIAENFGKKNASVVTGITFAVGLIFAGYMGKIMFDFIGYYGWSLAAFYLIGITSFLIAVIGGIFGTPIKRKQITTIDTDSAQM